MYSRLNTYIKSLLLNIGASSVWSDLRLISLAPTLDVPQHRIANTATWTVFS